MKKDTVHVLNEDPTIDDTMENVVNSSNVSQLPEEAPAENDVFEPAEENTTKDPPAPPTIGAIETSTDQPRSEIMSWKTKEIDIELFTFI